MEAIEEQSVVAQNILSDEEFYAFCQRNPDLRSEREPDGKLIIMPNSGGKTGKLNLRLYRLFFPWLAESPRGEMFDSSTAFRFPNGRTRPPNVAWIQPDRWKALTERQQEQFPPLCPDFMVELLSPTDVFKTAKTKMRDVWMQNGCRLAWLIDSKSETTRIFRANGEIQIVEDFDKTISGEDVLPGFEISLTRLSPWHSDPVPQTLS